MFDRVNHTQFNTRAAIQIGEVDSTTISSSQPRESQLTQQIRMVSNSPIPWQLATINREAESSAVLSTSANQPTISMHCTNIRSEDEQRVPNMTLDITVGVDANSSLYSSSGVFRNTGGNIVNNNVSSFRDTNDELPELANASPEQLQDLSRYINQLEREGVAQQAEEGEFSPLNTAENGINSTLNVADFDNLWRQREQEEFEEANRSLFSAAELRATEARTVEREELVTNSNSSPVDDEVEMLGFDSWRETFTSIEGVSNGWRPSLSAARSYEGLDQNSVESTSSARTPVEDDESMY